MESSDIETLCGPGAFDSFGLPLAFIGSVSSRLPWALIAAASLALVAGCITPSIPIPPPDPSEMRIPINAATGTATFSYGPEVNYAGALVYVYDRTREVGVIAHARADGSVGPSQAFPAGDGDNVSVSFQTADEVVSACVVIGTASPVPANFCTQ